MAKDIMFLWRVKNNRTFSKISKSVLVLKDYILENNNIQDFSIVFVTDGDSILVKMESEFRSWTLGDISPVEEI